MVIVLCMQFRNLCISVLNLHPFSYLIITAVPFALSIHVEYWIVFSWYAARDR